MYNYVYNGSAFCAAGITYPNFMLGNGNSISYNYSLSLICERIKNDIVLTDKFDDFAASSFEIDYLTWSRNSHQLDVILATTKFVVFSDVNWYQDPGGGYPYSSNDFYVYNVDDYNTIGLRDIFINSVYLDIFEVEIVNQINKEYSTNFDEYVYDYLTSDYMSWYINENGGITISIPEFSEFDIPYSKIKDLLTPYGQTLINSLGISTEVQNNTSLKHGNTIGNIMNYSAYTTDGTNLYYAGGENGYDWRLSKSSDKNLTNAERINQDYTDWVLYYDGWIYYRTASDDNCLYKIKPDGSGKTKLTDSKTARINIDNGKLYFRQNGAFYEMNTDGSGKRVLVNDNCYGSFVTDGKLYYLSDDSCSVIQYDILTGEKNWYDPNYVGYKIKYFTVDSQRGLIYSIADSSTGESAFRCISLRGGGKADIHGDGFKAYSFNLDDENIYLACELNGKSVFAVIDISTFKVTAEYDYPVIQREFYIIGDMIYYFDKDGAVYKMAKPV